jgi:hypothetical protein
MYGCFRCMLELQTSAPAVAAVRLVVVVPAVVEVSLRISWRMLCCCLPGCSPQEGSSLHTTTTGRSAYGERIFPDLCRCVQTVMLWNWTPCKRPAGVTQLHSRASRQQVECVLEACSNQQHIPHPYVLLDPCILKPQRVESLLPGRIATANMAK